MTLDLASVLLQKQMLILLPLFTPFGCTVRGEDSHKIASIGHSVLGNRKVRYHTGFSIVFFYINTCQFCHPFCAAVRGKAKLKILASASPYSVKPKVRYVSDFNIGSFTYMNTNCVTPFYPFLGCCQVLSHTWNACIGNSIFGEHFKVGYATVLYPWRFYMN